MASSSPRTLRPGLFHRGLAAVLMLGMAGTGFTGCAEEPTEIVAGMTTQIQVGKDMQTVGVIVRLGGRLIFCQGYDVAEGVARLPSTLGVIPAEGRDGVPPVEPVTVEVIGFRSRQGEAFSNDCAISNYEVGENDATVLRRRRMPYLSDRIIYLPMPIRESCKDVGCAENQTCLGGVCEDDTFPPEQVVDYRDDLIFGDTNTCFSPERCFPLNAAFPAQLIDADTCEFRVPLPEGTTKADFETGFVNVEVVYTPSFNTEILDLDDKEGFVLTESTDDITFRLAQNLCTSNYQKDKIAGVRVSPLCPPKTPLQPICDDELSDIQNGSRSPQSSVDTSQLCTVSLPLTPADSALYVLLDQSQSMQQFFSPDSLQFALSLSLQNPVAAKTQIAFSFVPAAQAACGTSPNDYDTPDIGFDEATAVQTPIASAVGDPNNVLAADGPLHLEGAMEGAYRALSNVTGTTTVFNRRALIVVGNRELQGTCTDPMNPDPNVLPQLAGDNLANNNLYTYVAVLERPDSAVDATNPVSDGGAIASSGGTSVFDGVDDAVEGAQAVQKVLSDLGSCVYDLDGEPGNTNFVDIFDTIDADNQTTQLTFIDPVTFNRFDVDRDDSCTEATQTTANGWSRTGSEVRICGQPCQQLRDTLNDTALFFAGGGLPAPEVPIKITVPCSYVDNIQDKIVVDEEPPQ